MTGDPNERATAGRGKRGESISMRVAHAIGVAIASGEYRPGETLDGEIEFSERLRVSRTAFREAMRTLAAKGMVEARQRTGTRVMEREHWHILDPDVVAWSFEREPDQDLLRSLLELRLIVEPEAAALAAIKRDSRDLARLGHVLEEMQRHDLASPDGRRADQDFHTLVLRASRNDALLHLARTVQAAINWVTDYKHRKGKIARDARPDHFEIFEAIAAGSAEAARAAMVRHITLSQAEAQSVLETSVLEAPAIPPAC